VNPGSRITVGRLRGPLLRSVSRSFYLSIRLLPGKLRDPIGLAYLLARATDTIADTVEIDPALRTQELANLAAMIQRHLPSAARANPFGSIAGWQRNEAERVLLQALPACLEWLNEMSSADRDEIRSVLAKINEGQALDVERFQNPSQVVALETAADLDRYTYLVAGSVGEFWTNVCFHHLPDLADKTQEEMVSSGVNYGKGLQLVNILRDVGADLRAGRCYLPADELHSLGVTPTELRTSPERADPLMRTWLERAEQGLTAGLEYACAIKPWRVRLASALPALIGARTLALLRKAGSDPFRQKIKVNRSDVRRIILLAAATGASPRSLRTAFQEHLSS